MTNLLIINAKALKFVYNNTETKKYPKVKYFGCILDQILHGE